MVERIPAPPIPHIVAPHHIATGTRRAMRAVPLPSPQQLMADLSEELSFSVAESQDYEDSDLERIEDHENAQRIALLRRIKELQGVYRSAYHDADTQFHKTLRQHERNREALEEFLRQPTPDASLNWHLLSQAHADGTLAKVLGSRGRADMFVQDWLKANGVAVQAGLNSLEAAQSHAAALESSLEQVQGFYQKEVAQFTSVVDVLAHMVGQFGVDKFDAAKNFIAQGVRADLTATHPSRDRVQLLNILQELQGIKSLNTIRWKLDTVLERFDSPQRPGLNKLTQQFIVFLPAPLEHAQHLFDFTRSASGEQQVLFLQGLVGTVRALDTGLFTHADMRARAMAALQQRVDELVLEKGY